MNIPEETNVDTPLIGPAVQYPTPWRVAEEREYGHVVATAEGAQACAVADPHLADLICQVVNAHASRYAAVAPAPAPVAGDLDLVGEIARKLHRGCPCRTEPPTGSPRACSKWDEVHEIAEDALSVVRPLLDAKDAQIEALRDEVSRLKAALKVDEPRSAAEACRKQWVFFERLATAAADALCTALGADAGIDELGLVDLVSLVVAQRDEARAEAARLTRELDVARADQATADSYGATLATVLTAVGVDPDTVVEADEIPGVVRALHREACAEVERLSQQIGTIKAHYQRRCDNLTAARDRNSAEVRRLRAELARETLRTSRALQACNGEPPLEVVGEAGLGYIAAQKDIRRAILAAAPSPVEAQPETSPAISPTCDQVHNGTVCKKPRVSGTNGCWGHYGPEPCGPPCCPAPAEPEQAQPATVDLADLVAGNECHKVGRRPHDGECDGTCATCAEPAEQAQPDSRQPRTWQKGDPEPAVGTVIRNSRGFIRVRSAEFGWVLLSTSDVSEVPWTWAHVVTAAPLTEVLPDQAPLGSLAQQAPPAPAGQDGSKCRNCQRMPRAGYLDCAECMRVEAGHRAADPDPLREGQEEPAYAEQAGQDGEDR